MKKKRLWILIPCALNKRLFVMQVKRCKKISNNELRERLSGIPGESTVSQLKNVVIPEMDDLTHKVNQNDFPNKENRFVLSFALAFRDWGWNIQEPTPLFSALRRLNDLYQRLEN